MITRVIPFVLGVLLAFGCGDTSSGFAGSGGGGASGAGAGGAAAAGTGGDGGNDVPPLDALAAEIGCPIFDALLPPLPPGFECPAGCTPAAGVDTVEDEFYLVACIPDAFLDRLTPGSDNMICMESPVDRVDYLVANPVFAQALADMCWVGCGTSPLDPFFQEWLELDFDLWLERCGDIWEL